MNHSEAFAAFVSRVLAPERARRLCALVGSKRGMKEICDDLCHRFESSIRREAVVADFSSREWDCPAFVFSSRMPFGQPATSLRAGHDMLAIEDSWLLISQDGRLGIHRPESRWDAEKKMRADPVGTDNAGATPRRV